MHCRLPCIFVSLHSFADEGTEYQILITLTTVTVLATWTMFGKFVDFIGLKKLLRIHNFCIALNVC